MLSLLGNGNGEAINSLSELGRFPLSSAPAKIPFFYVTGRIGLIAKKFKMMGSLFFSDGFIDVAVVGS